MLGEDLSLVLESKTGIYIGRRSKTILEVM
jgi:hypothetical protein